MKTKQRSIRSVALVLALIMTLASMHMMSFKRPESTQAAIAPTNALAPVRNVRFTNVTQSGARIHWDGVGTGTNYTVEVRCRFGVNSSRTVTTTNTFVDVSGLGYSSLYVVHITARNAFGTSYYISNNYLLTRPFPPTLVRFSHVQGNSTFRLESWSSHNGRATVPVRYYIQIYSIINGIWTPYRRFPSSAGNITLTFRDNRVHLVAVGHGGEAINHWTHMRNDTGRP